ncbi:MAG: hypothetical protein RLZZ324_76 [Candidatus Parcubacteria bacterium]|jgi:non-canonical purine NTP pyrophosphatase (RdgB/HAM1 family)
MHALSFATSDARKVPPAARVLARYGITVTHHAMILPDVQDPSAAIVAGKKVFAAYAAVQGPVIVQDNALNIRALGLFPGTDVKRVTGEIGIQGYLDLLEGFQDRACWFTDAIVYIDHKSLSPVFFIRCEAGSIALAPDGDATRHSSPLASIFIPAGYDRTVAALTPPELAAYRARDEGDGFYHRLARYLRKLEY